MHERDESSDALGEAVSVDGNEEYKLEYIRAMISFAHDDVQNVIRYSVAAFAVMVLLIAQIPLEHTLSLRLWVRLILCAGLVSLVVSAWLFFRYSRKVHLVRVQMIKCLPSLDAQRVGDHWNNLWRKHKRSFHAAYFTLGLGILAVSTVVSFIFLGLAR
jgi:hypothetical protein